MQNIEQIRLYLKRFAQQRDWEQFHFAKNLSMALSVEVAELLEHFQWLTPEQSDNLTEQNLHAVAEEIADIQMYLILLADRLNINILESVEHKTKINEQKYPVNLVKGSPKKYHQYLTQKQDD